MSSASPANATVAKPGSWVSDTTISQGIPWFRAVLDSMLISLGAFLVLPSMLHLSNPKFGNWQLCLVYAGMAAMACSSFFILWKTCNSSRIKDRQPVLTCLSIILLLFSGLSLTSLLVDSLEHRKEMTLFCCAIAVWTLICIALISIEQRLAKNLATKHLVIEKTVDLKQTAIRLFFAIITFIWGGGGMLFASHSIYKLSQGTFFDQMIAVHREPPVWMVSAFVIAFTINEIIFCLCLTLYSTKGLSDLHRRKEDVFSIERPWFKRVLASALLLKVVLIACAIVSCCLVTNQ